MEQASQLPNSNQPIFIEIFAGRGSLSKAASQAGFSVLSIDHEATGASVPIVQLDLTSSSGTAILWDILSSENILAVHLGIPCGTASRARERPVAPALQAMGVPNPPPLRSAQFPLGMPNCRAFTRPRSKVLTSSTGLLLKSWCIVTAETLW